MSNATRKLHALCISGEPNSTAHPYRVLNLVAALTGAGATSCWMIDEAAAKENEVAAADVVFLWRTAWGGGVDAIVRTARSNDAVIIFDADDLVIEPSLARCDVIDGIRTQGFTEQEVEKYYRRTLRSFEACDYACASTEELAEAMRRRGKETFVLHNGFDEPFYWRSRLAVRNDGTGSPGGLVRIGYATGTRTHQRDFACASESIASILRDRPECRLVLFRDPVTGSRLLDPAEFRDLCGLENRIEWRNFVPLQDLPDEMARFDINIAPLEVANPFCEAKSELKFVQAALVDICTVASPSGPFRRAITDGTTGFLAKDAQTWTAVLTRLLNNLAISRGIGRAAHRKVARTYGPQFRVELVAAMLDQFVERSRPRKSSN
jgi:O-antigen biosynthesis protein